MKNKSIIELIFGIGFLFFGLNIFFEFIAFKHPKVNAIIIVLLSITSLLLNLKKARKDSL
jgi:hypothetical protein